MFRWIQVWRLAQGLRSTNQTVRLNAVTALRKLGGAGTVELLVVALRDSDRSVQHAAESALKAIADERAVEALATTLQDSNNSIHSAAYRVLSDLGEQHKLGDVWPPDTLLTSFTTSKDKHLREVVPDLLAKFGGHQRAVKPLIAALKDTEWKVRKLAAEALGKLGDVRAVEPLTASLKDTDWQVQCKAAEALGKLGDVRAVGPLIALLQDTTTNVSRFADSVRASVLIALGNLRDVRAVGPLTAALNGTDAHVKRVAAKALGNLGSAQAVESLIAALNNTDAFLEVAEALGKLGDARAVEPLLAVLEREANLCVFRALGNLGHERGFKPVRPPFTNSVRDLNQGDVRAIRPLIAELYESYYHMKSEGFYGIPPELRRDEEVFKVAQSTEEALRRFLESKAEAVAMPDLQDLARLPHGVTIKKLVYEANCSEYNGYDTLKADYSRIIQLARQELIRRAPVRHPPAKKSQPDASAPASLPVQLPIPVSEKPSGLTALKCPSCQGDLTIPSKFAGQQLKCPWCSGTFTFPVQKPSPPPPNHTPAVAPVAAVIVSGMFVLTCTCGNQCQVSQQHAGKQCRCPKCSRTLPIPRLPGS